MSAYLKFFWIRAFPILLLGLVYYQSMKLYNAWLASETLGAVSHENSDDILFLSEALLKTENSILKNPKLEQKDALDSLRRIQSSALTLKTMLERHQALEERLPDSSLYYAAFAGFSFCSAQAIWLIASFWYFFRSQRARSKIVYVNDGFFIESMGLEPRNWEDKPEQWDKVIRQVGLLRYYLNEAQGLSKSVSVHAQANSEWWKAMARLLHLAYRALDASGVEKLSPLDCDLSSLSQQLTRERDRLIEAKQLIEEREQNLDAEVARVLEPTKLELLQEHERLNELTQATTEKAKQLSAAEERLQTQAQELKREQATLSESQALVAKQKRESERERADAEQFFKDAEARMKETEMYVSRLEAWEAHLGSSMMTRLKDLDPPAPQ